MIIKTFKSFCFSIFLFANINLITSIFGSPVSSSSESGSSENIDIFRETSDYRNESSTPPKALTLEEERDMQDSVFHWYPYQKIMYTVTIDGTIEKVCKPPNSSIDEFPTFLTRKFIYIMLTQTLLQNLVIFIADQRIQGLIAIHFFVALYVFIVIAFICDRYFLPSVERICVVLKISPVSLSI